MLTKSKKINIINSLDSWFVPKKKIVDIMRFVADVLKIDGELDLLLTDDKTIRKYNKRYRSIDRATDVLSFSVSDNVFVLPEEKVFGNIIISWEQLNCQVMIILKKSSVKRCRKRRQGCLIFTKNV